MYMVCAVLGGVSGSGWEFALASGSHTLPSCVSGGSTSSGGSRRNKPEVGQGGLRDAGRQGAWRPSSPPSASSQ
jgi:hypothetical protein